MTDRELLDEARRVRAVYVAEPHDDPLAIVRKLTASVGTDGFAVAA